MTREIKLLNIKKQIKRDKDLQPRIEMNTGKVEEYSEILKDGGTLPAVAVFWDEKIGKYLLADGFHRVAAHVEAGFESVQSEVFPGSRRDAILYSCAANATHGLPRTNADKNRAVTSMVLDPEWGAWSNRQIAKHCGVSNVMVGTVRRMVSNSQPKTASPAPGDFSDDPSLQTVYSEDASKRVYKNKHGKIATMDTSKIGKRRAKASDRPATAVSGDETGSGSSVSDNATASASDAPVGLEEAWSIIPDLKQAAKQIRDLRRHLQDLSTRPGGEVLSGVISQVETDCKNLASAVTFSIPHSVCPYCGGKKCKTCGKRGWVNERTAKQSAAMKEEV